MCKFNSGYLVKECFCDSAPILNDVGHSGQDWAGLVKALFIHPTLGSYCFIGELLLDIALKPDEPMAERCGQCRKCLDACPTNALSHPYRLDARRCISYLTIEYRGKLEDIYNEMLENHLFGCDVCLDACPWNAKAKANFHAELQPQEAFFNWIGVDLQEDNLIIYSKILPFAVPVIAN